MFVSDHYYSSDPKVESQEEKVNVELRGQSFSFITDKGVFSKKTIDFGTQLLIDTIQVPEHAKVLDVGCGYGPIGLTIAKTTPCQKVVLVDVNRRALALAEKNADLNQINCVEIFESNLLSEINEHDFDVVVSNPPIRAGKDVIFQLYEQSYAHLKGGGQLWIVIQKKQGAPSTITKLESMFSEVETIEKKKGYFIIRATK